MIEITPLPGVWIGDSREVILKELIEAMCPKGCILVWDEVEHGVNWVDLDKGADL